MRRQMRLNGRKNLEDLLIKVQLMSLEDLRLCLRLILEEEFKPVVRDES